MAVLRAGPTKQSTSNADKIQVELKRINPDQAFRANSVYRPGDSLVTATKHYICNKEVISGGSATDAFLKANFTENYVHMQTGSQGTGYMPEDYFKNVQPVLIFDNDSDELESSTTLGWVWTGSSSVWVDGASKNQKVRLSSRAQPTIEVWSVT